MGGRFGPESAITEDYHWNDRLYGIFTVFSNFYVNPYYQVLLIKLVSS